MILNFFAYFRYTSFFQPVTASKLYNDVSPHFLILYIWGLVTSLLCLHVHFIFFSFYMIDSIITDQISQRSCALRNCLCCQAPSYSETYFSSTSKFLYVMKHPDLKFTVFPLMRSANKFTLLKRLNTAKCPKILIRVA